MQNLKLAIEYDGSGFAGWAKQPGLPTIESALEAALGRILQQPVRLIVAGRTDAGVHARGQVVSMRVTAPVDPFRLRRSANQLLPAGIAIKDVAAVPDEFDARRSAVARTYSYSVLNRPFPNVFRRPYIYHHPGKLNVAALHEAAAVILGRHDFTAFTPTVTEHSYFEREVTLSRWSSDGDLLIYWISASSFLRNMVRVLVGTMIEVGRGRRTSAGLADLLRGAERPLAGKTAPPQGLCLERVEYLTRP